MAAVEVAAPVAAPAVEVPEVAQAQGVEVEGLAQGMDGVHIEQGQRQGQMPVPESQLHRACAEGNLDGVRACLTASLEALETLDMATGCTPIVLAIRGNFYNVVRELLSAGAIVPPPGLTNDPGMLSILYPPHMYGMQQFMPNMQGPAEFYPQSGPMFAQQGGPQGGFYPQERMYDQGPGGFGQGQMHQAPFHGHGGRDRKGSRSEVAGQLPPVEVAKMIPCRNFPQCKYGNGCAFYHPNRPFYAQGPAPGPGPNGFESFPGFQQFAPQEETAAQEAIPEGQEGAERAVNEEGAPAAEPPTPASSFQPNQPAFVPMSNRRQSFNQFPQGGKPFGHGKKPSFSGGPRPFAPRGSGGGDFGKWKDGMPPPCVFFAQGKCRNGEMCKFPHLDAEGNDCRHPDIIKGLIAPIPTGRRQPRTSFGYPPSGPGPMHSAAYDPIQRQQQLAFLQQQRAAVQQNQNGSVSSGSATPAIPTAPGPPVQAVPTTTSEEGTSVGSQAPSPSNATEATTTMGDSQTLVASTPDLAAGKADAVTMNTETAAPAVVPAPAQVPAAANLPVKPAAAVAPAVARSASQPGMPRAPNAGRGPFAPNARRPGPGRPFVNGNANNGRSASTEGHVRQNGAHARGANGNNQANANGNTANSNGNAKAAAAARQKVPGADDFPALGGLGQKVDSKQSSPVAPGRTAAQVLSAPAPEKPKEEFRPKEVKEVKEAKKDEAAEDEITMDSDNESDGVIITCKPSTGNTAPASGSSSPVKKTAPLSFASIAGALSSAASATSAKSEASSPAPVDAAPVAVKA